MALKTANFSDKPSELLRRFVCRVSMGDSLQAAIIGVMCSFRRSVGLKQLDVRIEPYLRHRRVFEIDYVPNLHCDGALIPLGRSFADGFRILLRKNCPSTRMRFTIAHELCHTFFYEYVPELKFEKHETDPGEERLCNIGAAELLMPARALRKQAKAIGTSLESLAQLANLFDVSLDAMLLRLRSVAGWKSELSTWYPKTGGGFLLHNLVGGRKVEWSWSEPYLLKDAWNTDHLLFGHTYLECRDEQGRLKVRSVFYELKRRRNSLLALFSQKSTDRTHPRLPLFELTQNC